MKIKVLFLLIILSLSLVPFVKADSTKWYDSSYLYRNIYEIDSNLVDEELIDFPVLVYLNSSYINWSRVNNDLSDILFTDSENNLLSHEIQEDYTINNESWIWVKIPIISSVIDTKFFLYYGFSGAESVENKSNVWSNGFVGVWHMNDNSTSTILDSMSNDNDGTKFATNQPTEVDGKIGKGQDGDDDSDSISFGGGLTDGLDEFTFEVWVDWQSYPPAGHDGYLMRSSGGGMTILMQIPRGSTSYWFAVNVGTGWKAVSIASGSGFDHMVFQFKKDDKVYLWQNGVKTSGDVTDNTAINTAGATLWHTYPSHEIDAITDEFRFHNLLRSDAWVGASYESQTLNLISLVETETFNEDYMAFGVIAVVIALFSFVMVITYKRKEGK